MSKKKKITVISIAVFFALLVVYAFVGSFVSGNAVSFVTDQLEEEESGMPHKDFGVYAEDFRKAYNDSLTNELQSYRFNEVKWTMDEETKYYDVVFSKTEKMRVYVNNEDKVIAVGVQGEKNHQEQLMALYSNILAIVSDGLSEKEHEEIVYQTFNDSLTTKKEESLHVMRDKALYELGHTEQEVVMNVISE